MSDILDDANRSDALPHDQRRARRPVGQSLRLRRHPDDRWFAGIAAGIAGFVGADPRVVRLVFALSVPLSLGITFLGYLVFWALIPVDAATPEAAPDQVPQDASTRG